jgi:hypothetical protein
VEAEAFHYDSHALRAAQARKLENGAIAQLGERFNGIEEVVGSIPSGSTSFLNCLIFQALSHKTLPTVTRRCRTPGSLTLG